MKQKRAKSLAQLIAAGTEARVGAAEHAVGLGLHVGTTALIDADLVPLLGYRDSHQTANAALSKLRATQRLTTKALYDVVFNARDFLKRSLGKHHSPAWAGTGFANSLRIPRTVVQLQNVAGVLALSWKQRQAWKCRMFSRRQWCERRWRSRSLQEVPSLFRNRWRTGN